MQATAIRSFPRPQTQFPQPISSSASHPAVTALLGLALTDTHAQGAYLYIFDSLEAATRMVAWAGLPPTDSALLEDLPERKVAAHFDRYAPTVLDEGAAADP